METVLEFLARINRRDPDKLAELMTEDHVFIDSLGQIVRGGNLDKSIGTQPASPNTP